MDTADYYMSVSFQLTLITERFITLITATHLILSFLQALNSYDCWEHPFSCDVCSKFQVNGRSQLLHVTVISNNSDY
jgi:hypothetical protein